MLRAATTGPTLSDNTVTARPAAAVHAGSETTTFAILVSLSVCHLLNDMNQSLVPALYPILKDTYRLDFGQIGLITLASQLTASMLQPVVGMVTDRRPQPYSLPIAHGLQPRRPAAAGGRRQLSDRS